MGICLLLAAWGWPSRAPAQLPDQRLSVQLGGGLIAIPGTSGVDPGAAFGVGVGWRLFPPLVVELGYLGAIFTEDREGAESEAAVENGGYLALVSGPFHWPVAPYLLGGFGVSHRRLVGDDPAPLLRPGTFVRVPIGAGVETRIRFFTIGLRGSYDFVFRSRGDRAGTSPRDDDELVVTLRIGALF